jgi:hypothetical protein
MMKRIAPALALCLMALPALAHPHFNKTVTAKLPSGVELTITYQTTPANEMQAQNLKVGDFAAPRRPMLKVSAELKTGAVTIPAGDYTIGVIKNGEKDWTMALYPGQVARGEAPDKAKLIKLDSLFEAGKGTAAHMLIDITPGHDKFEGRAVLTMHFGSLFLSGALTDAAPTAPAGK